MGEFLRILEKFSHSYLVALMEISPFAAEKFLTLERPQVMRKSNTALKIGVPKEVGHQERRVPLVPAGVEALVEAGHEVYVEQGAGEAASFSDEKYAQAGASIVLSARQVYEEANLLVKVFPPEGEALQYLKDGQILISALHLGITTPEFLKTLMAKRIMAIGYEFIREQDGSYPIVRMMHEISGSMAVQIAARYLESAEGGKGLMLGGISGIPPAKVVILGAGTIGEWAARTALGFGARVVVLDTELQKLRGIEQSLNRNITTAFASQEYINHAVQNADVVIGAMMSSGKRSPILVTEEMVQKMRPNSVIVDVVIDQGGCIETAKATSHAHPTYRVHNVLHYCVPNMPSSVAFTASYALSNVLTPFVQTIGESANINDGLWKNTPLRNGIYVYRSHLTKKSLANLFGLPYRDIELLIASGI